MMDRKDIAPDDKALIREALYAIKRALEDGLPAAALDRIDALLSDLDLMERIHGERRRPNQIAVWCPECGSVTTIALPLPADENFVQQSTGPSSPVDNRQETRSEVTPDDTVQ
jgi:hypothetical protein